MGIPVQDFEAAALRCEKARRKPAPIPADAAEDESDLQTEIIAYCRGKGWYVVWQRMDKRTRTDLGTPDLIIAQDQGRTLWVECKSREGKMRPSQIGVRLMLERLGHTHIVCRSLREFVEKIPV